MSLKDYIVFETPDGRILAAEDDHATTKILLEKDGNKLLTMGTFHKPSDAIAYTKQVIL